MGRNKIEIKKIEDKQTRNVTFSKRRQGLFKKAETASKMFGLQIGIITFSPAGGKPFVFSSSNSSSLDSIIDRFMSSSGGSSSSSSSMLLDLVGNKRNRSTEDGDDDDYVLHQIHETEKNHKRQKTMMIDTSTIPVAREEEEEEKDDEGFQRDLDFDLQTNDQELFNETLRGLEMDVAAVVSSSSSPDFLVESSSDNYYWPSDAELQEIDHQYPKNSSNGGFEYNAVDHHEEEENDDEGSQRDLDFDNQTDNDQEWFNEILRGFGMDVATTTTVPVASSSSLPEFVVEGSNHNYSWPSDAGLQEIDHHHHPNSSNAGFEYNDVHLDENSMFLLPPPMFTTTSTTSICNSISSSYTNELEEEEAGGGDEDDLGLTLEEWERVFIQEVPADWPSQEFLEHLLS